MRILSFCVIALLCLPSASATAGEPITPKEAIAALAQATKTISQKDVSDTALRDILKKMQAIRESDAYMQLSSAQQHDTLRLISIPALMLGEYELGKSATIEACTFDDSDQRDWYRRLLIAHRMKDYRDASVTLSKVAKQWPKTLSNLYDTTIADIVRQTGKLPDGKVLKLTLLQALFEAKWHPREHSPDVADFPWIDLVGLYVDAGDLPRAKAVAAVIVNPTVIKQLLAQKTFDAITTADPARFDIDKAWEASLKRARDRAAEKPNLLEAQTYLASRLYQMDRQKEALEVVDAALARIADKKKPAFEDLDDELNWAHNMRSDILFALGRDDDALAALKTGADTREYGSPNISQTINLAFAYAYHGRPQDALKTLTRLDAEQPETVSDIGRIACEYARALALVQIGDTAALAKSRAYLEAHADDAPEAVIEALLFIGDLDAAAKLTIAALADSEHQTDVLNILHIAAQPKLGRISPQQQILLDRYAALRARPDVAKAVDSIGRILKLTTI